MNNKKIEKKVSKLDFAFQPIVDINSGLTIAYEALLRDYDKAGYKSIDSVFDNAYKRKTLHTLDILLRQKVLKKIKPIYEINKNFKIFYNLDNRILEVNDYEHGQTKKLLSKNGYKQDFIVFEVSEKHEFKQIGKAQKVFDFYSSQGFNLALDDFGIGYSGLKTLYLLDPQYIKIDRFFIKDILSDRKKKLFLTNIINIAHQSGIKVLAEGVETKDELDVCRQIGCDLAQGYYVQRPTQNISDLKFAYCHIKADNSISNSCEVVCEANLNLNNMFESSNVYSQIFDKYVISTTTDLKGNITNATKAFCAISGYGKAELIGSPHNIVRDKNMDRSVFKDMWKTIKKGGIWCGTISNTAKNGFNYYLETTIYPQFSNSGDIIGYASVGKDVTFKKLYSIEGLCESM